MPNPSRLPLVVREAFPPLGPPHFFVSDRWPAHISSSLHWSHLTILSSGPRGSVSLIPRAPRIYYHSPVPAGRGVMPPVSRPAAISRLAVCLSGLLPFFSCPMRPHCPLTSSLRLPIRFPVPSFPGLSLPRARIPIGLGVSCSHCFQ